MLEKNKIGVLMHGDPTRGGTIMSEIKFLFSLYENNSDCEFYMIAVNPTLCKKIKKTEYYNFCKGILKIFNTDDLDVLESMSCIISYPSHSNFFGGYINDNEKLFYKIISKCTNVLNIPVFIRINDSEIKVRDYRKMCEIRLGGKPESAFLKDPINVGKAKDLVSWQEWDYSKIFWFANGSKDACDWVAETMFDREEESMRMAPRQTFVDNAIYVSDDIFFLISKNFDRFEERYKKKNGNLTTLDKFCYIGFFDTVNAARAKALNILFKSNSYKIPFKIFGKGTEVLTKFADKPNVEIEEGFIKGDSEEYFDFLHDHLAYIFIGKGQSESRYIGKTAYDAVVARTPIVVYRKCDTKQITFDNDEYYFDNEKELNDIYVKLQDPKIRNMWIEDQAKEIFKKLPPSSFKFSAYNSKFPSRKLQESDFFIPVLKEEVEPTPKKQKVTASPLF